MKPYFAILAWLCCAGLVLAEDHDNRGGIGVQAPGVGASVQAPGVRGEIRTPGADVHAVVGADVRVPVRADVRPGVEVGPGRSVERERVVEHGNHFEGNARQVNWRGHWWYYQPNGTWLIYNGTTWIQPMGLTEYPTVPATVVQYAPQQAVIEAPRVWYEDSNGFYTLSNGQRVYDPSILRVQSQPTPAPPQ